MRKLSVLLLLAGAAVVFTQRARLHRMAARSNQAIESTTQTLAGGDMLDAAQRAKRQLLQASLIGAIGTYRAVHGESPHGWDDLVQDGLLQRSGVQDEWGHALEFEPSGERVRVRSLGRDGRKGTADDWTIER